MKLRPRTLLRFAAFLILPGIVFGVSPVYAETLPFSVRQAVVKVYCGDKQGSGVVVNPDQGYVLTNAHILLNETTLQPDACELAFLENDATTNATILYTATDVHYVFDESHNLDFAILKIGAPETNKQVSPFPYLKTDEFSIVGNPLSIAGYPGASKGRFTVTSGTISGLEQGIIMTDAVIAPGNSGGPGIDANNHLIGLATRILLREISPGVEEVVDYELMDIRGILTWMDTFGTNADDLYVTHADPDRYHGVNKLISTDKLDCKLLARSPINSTVYCLKMDNTRTSFPSDDVYYSWFSDFSAVVMLQPEDLAPYRLTSNVTMKPGTLIKVTTDPKVYLIADAQGTLRWVENEARARELYGNGWAGFVKDVPDTFFINYRIGSPIQ